MTDSTDGWRGLQRREGPTFLKWLRENGNLIQGAELYSKAVSTLLLAEITTGDDAREVWAGVPGALQNSDSYTAEGDRGIVDAYAWLHFLERYVRTWRALEHLVQHWCLPMGTHGVRALDVGAGLGPAAFAIHDFYRATVEFADGTGSPMWRQPVEVKCVEKAGGFNALRHHISEFVHQESGGRWPSVLSITSNLPDFADYRPQQDRKERFATLRDAEEDYLDESSGEWTSDRLYSAEEANGIAQSLHRYRLFSFANFFAGPGIVDDFKENLAEVLDDASPGSAMLVIGGKKDQYPETYKRLTALAEAAGFRQMPLDVEVASTDSEVASRVYEGGRRLYSHLQGLARNDEPGTKDVRAYFQGQNSRSVSSSKVQAYRKGRFG